MRLHRYQEYILRNLQVSKHYVPNVHECSVVSSTHLQISPLSTNRLALLNCAVSLIALTAARPIFLVKTSRRTKTASVSGARIRVRRTRALTSIDSLKVLSFYYAVNFRGFTKTPLNKTQNIALRHVGFSRQLFRAFDYGLMGFEDEDLQAFLQIYSKGICIGDSLIPRAFRLPMIDE